MWGAGEPNLYEAIDMEDALSFLQIAISFEEEEDLEKVFKWVCSWLLRCLTLLELPSNGYNLFRVLDMLSLRLELSSAQYRAQSNADGSLYAFDPVEEPDDAQLRDTLWRCVVVCFGDIAETHHIEGRVRDNASRIQALAWERTTKDHFEPSSNFVNPVYQRLVRRPMMDGLENAWETRQLYYRRRSMMVLWFRCQEGAHSKLAIRHPPRQYSVIGTCHGASLEQTNHAPSYCIPHTSDTCEYLYAFRSPEVFDDDASGEGVDLVRFDLRQSIEQLRHEEVIIRNVARHTHGWFINAHQIIDAYNDEIVLFIATVHGKDHGQFIVELNVQTRALRLRSPLHEQE